MVLRSSWKSRHKNSCGPAPRWIRPGLAALLWLCAIRLACGIEVGEIKNIVQKDAEFDANYNDTVTSENQTIYAFNHTISRNKVSSPPQTCRFVFSPLKDYYQSFLLFPSLDFQTEGVRVSVDVLSNKSESPILFVVRQKQGVLSFQVPLILRGLWVPPTVYIHNIYTSHVCDV